MAYTRQKHQYRNAQTVIGKFTVGGSGTTLTRLAGTSEVSSNFLSCSAIASNAFTLTFPKSRKATVVSANVSVGSVTPANQRLCHRTAEPNASAGTVTFLFTDLATPSGANPADGSVVTIVMELAT